MQGKRPVVGGGHLQVLPPHMIPLRWKGCVSAEAWRIEVRQTSKGEPDANSDNHRRRKPH